MFQIALRKRPTIAWRLVCGLALSAALALPSLADAKTITAVMHSDLRIIDPGFTTAYITRDHGYMVYDTLLATDSNFKIQPQMADWKVSDDKLTYTFTLARRPEVARRHASDGGGLRRLAETLGHERQHGPEADGFHRQPRSHRCRRPSR